MLDTDPLSIISPFYLFYGIFSPVFPILLTLWYLLACIYFFNFYGQLYQYYFYCFLCVYCRGPNPLVVYVYAPLIICVLHLSSLFHFTFFLYI